MSPVIISEQRAFDGVQGVYRHASEACGCDMTFALYLPPQARHGRVPLLWFLSGLTATHANAMEKAEYRRYAAERGVAVICPDTSPRGETVPNDEAWYVGQGAGHYVDATEPPWSRHYRMARYVAEELPALVGADFPLDLSRQGITGFSMGGHGAITLALKLPGRFKSVSAFAPIVQPSTAFWARPAFERYLGPEGPAWRAYDTTSLLEDGHRLPELLVDQGSADKFLNDGLRPALLEAACAKANVPLTLRMQDGYDHSFYFVSSFIADHVQWHAERLRRA